jgi:hypothetical protein
MENDKDFAFMVRGEPGDMNKRGRSGERRGPSGGRGEPDFGELAEKADMNRDKMISFDELRLFG